MARLSIAVLTTCSVLLAYPAAAQDRRPETAEQAGLRYLNWPGRPPVSTPPVRAERQNQARPRFSPTPRAQTPTRTPADEPTTPERVTAQSTDRTVAPVAPVAPTPTTNGEGARYYSVHRPSGRTPDTIDRAQVLAADQTLVALQSPQGQSLAEQDRTARAEEAFEILRNLPPDQLMEMLGRQP